jgi:hypothetical protein
MDAKTNPHAVQLPLLVEATGLDGRFLGALRPFPGMADETVHGVPRPDSGTTIQSIDNIELVKYVSVQKGTSRGVFKGLAIIGDNPGGTGKSLYFAYWDTQAGTSDVIELEDYDSWDDFKLTTYDEIDITSMGRYIYVSISGDTTSTVTQWDAKEAPYNKAYFWDYKINSWDKFVSGFDKRFMGLMPQRLLGHPLQEDDDGSYIGDSSDTMATEVYGPTGHITSPGEYTYAVELVSRKHNLRSYLRFHTETALGTPNSGLRYFVDEINLPVSGGGSTNQIRGNAHSRTCLINWGIPHVDGFRLWRTPVNASDTPFDEYTATDSFYMVDDYIEKMAYQPTSAIFQLRFDHDSILGTTFGDAKSTWFGDSGLLTQTKYRPFSDPFHPTPRLKRIQAYDGLLVGITEVIEPTTPDQKWQPSQRVPEAIVWSITDLPEPENFPPESQYRPDDAGEKFYSLEPAGDALFAVTNSSIYRMTRSGGAMAINRLQFKVGGVSRYGQVGVGNSLFVVTPAGLKQINGNTGAINSVSALDRVLLSDAEWASTLGNVTMEFDATVGALILLNTSKKEAYILWEATGTITKLEDAPWAFLTAGPDALTNGPSRAYWVMSDGAVHCIDGRRAMGKRSMCGVTGNETVNGTFKSGSSSTVLQEDSPDAIPENCVGFKLYVMSGELKGESTTFLTWVQPQSATFEALSGDPAVGDEYAIAPVITRLVLPVMVGQGGQPDPFTRKIGKSFQASFSDLAGETGSDDVNSTFDFGFKQMDTDLGSVSADFNIVPDKTVAYLNRASTRLFPYLEFKGGNQDWELQSVVVHGVLSMSEAQSRQG